MPLLELRHLKKYFASQRAVDDISFSIEKGHIFGLLGPNGAGKTTLIRMITGILFPDEGTILFDGKPFDPAKNIINIGYMPEERGLYKKMKIGEQIIYLAQLKGMSRSDALEKSKDWFVKLEMETWWNRKVEELSKGMSQKVQFITTVLHQPKLIILDEPFSGLDPVNTNLIKDEIFKLSTGGSTIIFSTHRMEQVEEICSNIILVNNGSKILDGTVKQVREDFKENLFTIGVDQLPVGGGDSRPFDVIGSRGNEHTIRIREGQRPRDVLYYLMQQGADIHLFKELLPSLNDIFIKLVEGTPAARQFEKVSI